MKTFNPIGMFNAKRIAIHTIKFKAYDKHGKERRIKVEFQTDNRWEEMTANTVLRMVNQKLIENDCAPLTFTAKIEKESK